MENVAGGTLDAFWRSFGSRLLPVDVALDLARQVCRGLAVAHAETPPVIHRDIKPQNILVGYEARGLRARISDFGLARQVNPLTLLASSAGTLPFKPPEVFANAKSDSPAGDVYAVGVTLYLLLSDCFPYEIGPDFATVSASDFDKQPRPLSELNFDVDSALSDIVARCIARDVHDRYPDARALLAALDAHAEKAEKNSHAEFAESAEPGGSLSTARPSAPSRASKTPPRDDPCADEMVRRALKAAREDGHLADAADLMEEAFNLKPGLREKYVSRVKLWRAGVSM